MKNVYKNQSGFALGSFLLEFIQSIVLALSVFVLIYLFVAQPNEVKGSSMYPNFVDKEYLLTDKLSYQFGDPKRGDVVIFKAPASESCSAEGCEYIKRVIGMPGDRVMIENGDVYLNGELLDQSFLPDGVMTEEEEYIQEGVELIVPDGQYLCFGDNRPNSRDGRAFGPIDRSSIVGKAFLKYWPIHSIGLVPKVSF
ncbi:MAG: signal peptidase I [Candidatus Shapirobacteria bacterium]|nr:signal peptidase I [Candidatus Shapirobacteria bacterium]